MSGSRSCPIALLTVCMLTAGWAFPAAGSSLRDALRRMPDPPASPTSMEECEAFRRPWRELQTQASREHQECLNDGGSGRPTGGDQLVCSKAECQGLHDIVYGSIGKRVDAADRECRNRVYAHQQEQREAERQRQAYVDAQAAAVRNQGDQRRQAQRNAHEAAERTAYADAARYGDDASHSSARAVVLGSAAQRNIGRIFDQQGSGGAGASGSSIADLLGGSLASTLDSLRGWMSSSSAGSGRGAESELLDYVPSSLNLERASATFDLFDWSGSGLLSSAASTVSYLERGSELWGLWSAMRAGDSLGAVGSGAALAADMLLPTHAAFFAVPAINATVAVHSAALGELDRAFAEFDAVSRSGSAYFVPPAFSGGSLYDGDFRSVQQAYVESICDYCRWDKEKKSWQVSVYNELLEVDTEGAVSIGWLPVQQALSER